MAGCRRSGAIHDVCVRSVGALSTAIPIRRHFPYLAQPGGWSPKRGGGSTGVIRGSAHRAWLELEGITTKTTMVDLAVVVHLLLSANRPQTSSAVRHHNDAHRLLLIKTPVICDPRIALLWPTPPGKGRSFPVRTHPRSRDSHGNENKTAVLTELLCRKRKSRFF